MATPSTPMRSSGSVDQLPRRESSPRRSSSCGANRRRRRRRQWPNFFVGFRISSPPILAQVEQLQTSIRASCPDATSFLIDPRTLHVTLCVMRLPDASAIELACQVLQAEAARAAATEFAGSELPSFAFGDWNFFGNNDVLYAKMDVASEHGKRLSAVAERLHNEFGRLGFTTERFRRPFTPHLTVWKSSRDRKLLNSLNASRGPDSVSVQDEIFHLVASHSAAASTETMTVFGTEHPTSIELLSMKEREEDGYYGRYATARWVNSAD